MDRAAWSSTRVHQPLTRGEPDSRATAVDQLLAREPAGLPKVDGTGTPLDPRTVPTVFGVADGVWRDYVQIGGVLRTAAVWSDDSGSVMVTCLFGPSDWVTSAEATAIVLSLTQH